MDIILQYLTSIIIGFWSLDIYVYLYFDDLWGSYLVSFSAFGSLSHGLSIFQEGKSCDKDTLKMETNADNSKVNFVSESLYYRIWASREPQFYNVPIYDNCRNLKVMGLLLQGLNQNLKTQQQKVRAMRKNLLLLLRRRTARILFHPKRL